MDLFFSVLLQLFEPQHFVFLTLGVLLGLAVGILPGLGGTTGLAILLPFVSAFEPSLALALMIGVLAPTTTSDTFPAVLIGIPGTAGSQATVLDGFSLAKQGMAARALSAAFTASLFGGLWGAVILSFSIVFAKPIILSVGFGEQLLLIILALIMVGALTGANLVKGVASCTIGLVLGAIGLAEITGDPRLTFGTLYLSEGVPLIVVGMGLFAIPEIVSLLQSRSTIAGKDGLRGGWGTGIRDVARNWFLVLRCSSIGVIVGALPGLGGTVVDWIAYSHMRQTVRNTENLGKGDIRGVIAPESANNAKEGGALIPTILFGIPGSGNKVLLLGGFLLIGIEPGMEMVTTQLDMTYLIVWSLALANVVGAGICIFLARPMSRITTMPYYLLAPVLIALIFFATFQINRDWNDFLGLMFFGLLGVVMKTYGWSRPALLIGFFLSSKIELLSYQTSAVYGLSFLTRTGSIILIAVALATVWFLLRQKLQTEEQSDDTRQQRNHMVVTAGFLILPALMMFGVLGLNYRASVYPMAISGVLVAMLLLVLLAQAFGLRATRAGAERPTTVIFRDVFSHEGEFWPQLREFGYLGAFFALIVVFGFPIATMVFVFGFIISRNPSRYLLAFTIAVGLIALMWLLSYLLTLQYPAGLISNVIQLPWWLAGN